MIVKSILCIALLFMVLGGFDDIVITGTGDSSIQIL